MNRTVLIVVVLAAVALLVAGLSGKITGNAFATPSGYSVPRSCTDSDGNNPYLKGTGEYKGLSSAKLIPFADTCVNAANLLEHYCNGIAHLTKTIPCKCENGACKKY